MWVKRRPGRLPVPGTPQEDPSTLTLLLSLSEWRSVDVTRVGTCSHTPQSDILLQQPLTSSGELWLKFERLSHGRVRVVPIHVVRINRCPSAKTPVAALTCVSPPPPASCTTYAPPPLHLPQLHTAHQAAA
ncbi:hypothetical protein J6590_014892 [Homalodisca vitripennis]|nr:hypothetical protein J6590_014892 [Homalodisca vitripennis]